MSDAVILDADSTGMVRAVEAVNRALQRYNDMQKTLTDFSKQAQRTMTRVRDLMKQQIAPVKGLAKEYEKLGFSKTQSANLIKNAQTQMARITRDMEATAQAQAASEQSRHRQLIHNADARIVKYKAEAREAEAAARVKIVQTHERAATKRTEIAGDNRLRLEQERQISIEKKKQADLEVIAARARARIDTRRQLDIMNQMNRSKREGSKQLDQMVLKWETIGRIMLVTVGYRLINNLVMSFQQGVRSAGEFQRAVAEVQTISQAANMTHRQWADGLQRVSDNWRLDLLEQTEAAYQAISNQVVHGAEAFEFLESANKFAAAAIVETNEAVRLVSAVLNAYRLDISKTDEVFAAFFKTIELGRLRGADLTEIGRIMLPGKQIGVEYQEIAAAMATLTRQGVNAKEAMTFLRGIFQQMIRPSEKMKEFFQEIGVSSADAAIKTYGFAGFLRQLEDRFKGSSEELGELFRRVRALTGIFGLSGSALNDFERDLEEVTNASKSYNRAVEIITRTSSQKLDVALSKIRNHMVRLGDSFLDTASAATGGFDHLVTVVKGFVEIVKGAAIPVIVLLTTKLLMLAKTALLTPFGAIMAAMVGIGIAIQHLATRTSREFERMAEAGRKSADAVREHQQRIIEQEQAIQKEYDRIYNERTRSISRYLAEQAKEAGLTMRALVKSSEEASKGILDVAEAASKSIEAQIKVTEESIKDLEKSIEDTLKTIGERDKSLESTLFEWELEKKKGQEALDFLTRRIETFKRQAAEAGARGELENLKALGDEVLSLVIKRRDLTKKIQADEARNAEKRTELEKKLGEVQGKHLEDLHKLQRQTPQSDKDRLAVEQQRAELITEHQKQVRELQTQYNQIDTSRVREVDHVQELINKTRELQTLERALAGQRSAELAKQREALAQQEIQKTQLEQLTQALKDYKVSDILALEDPEAQALALRHQYERMRDIKSLAKEIGIEEEKISVLEAETQRQRQLIEKRMHQQRIKDLQKEAQEISAIYQQEKSQQEAILSERERTFRSLAQQLADIRTQAMASAGITAGLGKKLGSREMRENPGSRRDTAAQRYQRAQAVRQDFQNRVNSAVTTLGRTGNINSLLADPDKMLEARTAMTSLLDLLSRAGHAQEPLAETLKTTIDLMTSLSDEEGRTLDINTAYQEYVDIKNTMQGIQTQQLTTLGRISEALTGETATVNETATAYERLETVLRRLQLLGDRAHNIQPQGPARSRMTPAAPRAADPPASGAGASQKMELNVSIHAPTGRVDPKQIADAVNKAQRYGLIHN
jgi:TP901 family phage tail tape measure protein